MRYCKNIFSATLLSLIIALCSPIGFAKEQTLPSECTTQCNSPYGEILGVGLGNVPAYSNCNADCVVFSPNKNEGTYTGIKWQCVEYARRWLLINKGVVYGDVDIAADIWGLDYVTRIKDKSKLNMLTYTNGSKNPPVAGDLLIYAKAYLNTGHVAVVTTVDHQSNTIHVAEQNFDNTKWRKEYSRSIPFVRYDNQYWILDEYLLGWKHVTDQQASNQ